MGDFIKNNPFRFWCQKVLPLVYDDSLSYYELLCKVVGKLNELAENQNNLSDEIKAVAKDLDDFKAQVPGMVEAKVEEWLNNYITTHGLVTSVNGMTGEVTLTAADVGAIANVNGSVKNNNIADGAVTTDKMAAGVIPTKLPNPQKLTFSGAVTGEYDGSQAVNIDIPAGGGGGGGGAVDSVNGMTGAVVLKKLTAGEGLSMSGADGYNGSAEQSVGIAPGGVSGDKIADGAVTEQKIANDAVTTDKIANGAVTGDKIAAGGVTEDKITNGAVTGGKIESGAITGGKIASGAVTSGKIADGAVTAEKMAAGVIPTKLPTPNALTAGDGLAITDGSFNGSKAASVSFAPAVKINATGTKIDATIYVQENQFLALAPCYIKITGKVTLNVGDKVTATFTKQMNWQNRMGIFPVYLYPNFVNKYCGIVRYNYNSNTYVHTITFLLSDSPDGVSAFSASGILGID